MKLRLDWFLKSLQILMSVRFLTRIYQGTFTPGQNYLNSSNGKKEKIAKMVVMHSK